MASVWAAPIQYAWLVYCTDTSSVRPSRVHESGGARVLAGPAPWPQNEQIIRGGRPRVEMAISCTPVPVCGGAAATTHSPSGDIEKMNRTPSGWTRSLTA